MHCYKEKKSKRTSCKEIHYKRSKLLLLKLKALLSLKASTNLSYLFSFDFYYNIYLNTNTNNGLEIQYRARLPSSYCRFLKL